MSRHAVRILTVVIALALPVAGSSSAVAKPSGDGPGNKEAAQRCHMGGWESLATSEDEPFAGEEECVAYAAQGGELQEYVVNGQIAFRSSRSGADQVHLMDPGGGNVTQLTSEGGSMPAWSPNGEQVAFISSFDVFVVDADGGNPTQVTSTHPESVNLGPAWSPEGDRLAFYTDRDDVAVADEPSFFQLNYEIYAVDTDGGNLARLTTDEGDEVEDVDPAWSPDGERIVFASAGGIWVMDADGGNPMQVTTGANHHGPAWSPDGEQIAFTAFTTGEEPEDTNWDVYVMDADGANVTQLTADPAHDTEPAWSPDGEQIAFTSARDDNTEIYVMDADGGAQTRVTTNSASDDQPSWGVAN